MAVHKCSIIADPEGYGWEYAKAIYNSLKARFSDFDLNPVNIKRFRDGEIKPKIEVNVRKRNCYFIHNPNLPPSEWFLQLCLVNQALKKSGAQEIINVFPYLKFSRQDRKDESRVPISARVIADAIELYADRVLTIDFHNLTIDGFYKIPLDNLSSFPVVIKYLNDNHKEIFNNLVIMSPDAGGAGRAKFFAKKLGISEIAIGYKHREKAGEVDTFKLLGDVANKDIFIIDDMVDSGNTLITATNILKQNGANKIYGYATHGLFTEGIKKVSDNFDKFFIGDTIKLKEQPDNVEVIPFTELFAEAIYRTSEGESLSELFK